MTEDWEGIDSLQISSKVAEDNWHDEDNESLPDNWDASDDEGEKEQNGDTIIISKKPESKLKQKIREREEAEAARKAALKEEQGEDDFERDLTPAEIRAKQEEESIMMVKEMIEGPPAPCLLDGTIDAMMPSSKEEFEEFRKRIQIKALMFKDSPHFPLFLDQLFRTLADELELEDIKAMSQSLNVLVLKKESREKEKKKKAGKKKGGANVTVEAKNDFTGDLDDDYDDHFDEYADFM